MGWEKDSRVIRTLGGRVRWGGGCSGHRLMATVGILPPLVMMSVVVPLLHTHSHRHTTSRLKCLVGTRSSVYCRTAEQSSPLEDTPGTGRSLGGEVGSSPCFLLQYSWLNRRVVHQQSGTCRSHRICRGSRGGKISMLFKKTKLLFSTFLSVFMICILSKSMSKSKCFIVTFWTLKQWQYAKKKSRQKDKIARGQMFILYTRKYTHIYTNIFIYCIYKHLLNTNIWKLLCYVDYRSIDWILSIINVQVSTSNSNHTTPRIKCLFLGSSNSRKQKIMMINWFIADFVIVCGQSWWNSNETKLNLRSAPGGGIQHCLWPLQHIPVSCCDHHLYVPSVPAALCSYNE